jgi:hypothetical protein
MDTSVLRIFQIEIAFQCRVVISSAYELQAALVLTRSSNEIWKHLQAILIASASLSKMLWGSGGGKEDERAPLRESLQVADTPQSATLTSAMTSSTSMSVLKGGSLTRIHTSTWGGTSALRNRCSPGTTPETASSTSTP